MAFSARFPRVSPDGLYVASGATGVYVGQLSLSGDGRTYNRINQVTVRATGASAPKWLNTNTIFYQNFASANVIMERALAPAFTPVFHADVLGANEYDAGGNLWAVWEAGNNRVLVSTGASHGGARAPAADQSARYLYITNWQTSPQRLFLGPATLIDTANILHPSICEGGAVWTRVAGGIQETWGWKNGGLAQRMGQAGVQEFNPVAINTPNRTDGPWVLAHNQTSLFLRPWASPNTLLVATGTTLEPHAVYVSTGVNAGYFVVAWADGTPGGLRVVKVLSTGTPPPAPTPPPGNAFAVAPIGRRLDLGYFHIVGRYGDYTTQATQGAANFGFVDELNFRTDQNPDLLIPKAVADLKALGAKVMIGGTISEINRAAAFWNDVLGLFVAHETSGIGTGLANAVQTTCQALNARMTALGLPQRPILNYYQGVQLDAQWVDPPALDWVGIEGYFDWPTSAATAQAFLQTRLAKIKAKTTKPLVLIAQAYDRSSLNWKNHPTDIGNLQPVYANLARADAQISGIAWFNYARSGAGFGGTLFYSPYLRPWHVNIYTAQLSGTPPSPTPPPPTAPARPLQADFLTMPPNLMAEYPNSSSSLRSQVRTNALARKYTDIVCPLYVGPDQGNGPAYDYLGTPASFVPFQTELVNVGLRVCTAIGLEGTAIGQALWPPAAIIAALPAIVTAVNAKTTSYLIGIEADEYWTTAQITSIGQALRAQTSKPIYLHLLPGRIAPHSSTSLAWWASNGWCSGISYQWGNKSTLTAAIMKSTTQNLAPRFHGLSPRRQFIAGEYSIVFGQEARSITLGNGALAGGADGFMNGGKGIGLPATPPPPVPGPPPPPPVPDPGPGPGPSPSPGPGPSPAPPPAPTPPPTTNALLPSAPATRAARRAKLTRAQLYPHLSELHDDRSRRLFRIAFDRTTTEENARVADVSTLNATIDTQNSTIVQLTAQITELLTRNAK